MKLKPTVYVGIIVAAAISRLVPHAPNFTPIGALALFAGAQFEGRIMAFAVPVAAMLLSDAVLGFWFYHDMPAVYAAFLLTVLMGRCLRRWGQNPKASAIATASVLSATVFYVLTNFSVWLSSGLYPHTVTGLVTCYVMAIPFFGNTLASGLFYSLIMFGAARLADRTVLRPMTS
jgi:hypothetical protein